MLKKILNKNFRTLTLSPQAFFAELREWFFMIDNKGLLYMEETEPKIYPNAIKDEKFMRMFYRNLERNNLNKYPAYGWYSKCWGEYNFVRCANNVPIVFQHLIQEDGKYYLSYGLTFKIPFEPENLFVDQEGGMYHKFDHPHIKYGIIGSGLAVSLSEKLKAEDSGFVFEWEDKKYNLKPIEQFI